MSTMPTDSDAMGWLADFADCLNGEHGQRWQEMGNAVILRDDLPDDGTSWMVWRDLRRAVTAVERALVVLDEFPVLAGMREVLDLHASDAYGDCPGCDIQEWVQGITTRDEEAHSWPCPTVLAVLTALGVAP